MQPLNQKPLQNACDVGLLPSPRVTAFRAFLDGQGVQTRDGRGGQYFHVRTTAGWAPIQRGKRDQVATPKALRAVVEDFLKAPIGKAILSGHSRSLFQPLPAFPPNTTEVQRITTLVAEAQGMSHNDVAALIVADANKPLLDLPGNLASLQTSAREYLGIDPASGSSSTHETTLRLDQAGGVVEVLDSRLLPVGAGFHVLQPGANPATPADTIEAKPVLSLKQREYLRDLRDDFALRAPLVMNEGETMATFADRCWQYADLMIDRRPSMTGD